MAKTCALCIIASFKDLEMDARKKSAVRACAWRANYFKWGQGGEGEGGYIISQQKVEEASLFWDRWRNFLLNNFLTPKKIIYH